MYGDDLTQAIKIINAYLRQGETIALWDGNNDFNSITLDENSELKFAVRSLGIRLEVE